MKLRVVSLAMAVAALAVGAAIVAHAESAKSAATPWKITGELEESCSCDGACPCWFGNKPTKSTCSGNEAIFITKGSYGKVPLDGLAIAGYVQSPEGKSMMESMGSWNFSYLYVDEKANPEQRKALEAIAMQMFPPGAPAEKSKIQYAPITRKIEGKEHTITVGSYGEFSGHLLEGGLGGTPTISNPLLPDPTHKQYSQGVTTHHKYNDAAQWEFTGSNYMYNRFTVTNKDYEAMAAMMQKGMGGGEKH
jgi:hypothetical protein